MTKLVSENLKIRHRSETLKRNRMNENCKVKNVSKVGNLNGLLEIGFFYDNQHIYIEIHW